MKQELLKEMEYFLDLLDDEALKYCGRDILANISNVTEVYPNRYVVTNGLYTFPTLLMFDTKQNLQRTILTYMFKPRKVNKYFSLYDLSDKDNEKYELLVNFFYDNKLEVSSVTKIYNTYFRDKDNLYIWLFTQLYKTTQSLCKVELYLQQLCQNKLHTFNEVCNTGNIGLYVYTEDLLDVDKYIDNLDYAKLLNIKVDNKSIVKIINDTGYKNTLVSYDIYNNHLFINLSKNYILLTLKNKGMDIY